MNFYTAVWIASVLICPVSAAFAAESVPLDRIKLRKALSAYAIATGRNPRAILGPDNSWTEAYILKAREHGIPVAIELLGEESAKQTDKRNIDLLSGLNQYLFSNAMAFGKEADADASKIAVAIREKYCILGEDVETRCPEWKNAQRFDEGSAWKDWWVKYQHEEYIFNFTDEVVPEVTQLVLQYVRGTASESKAAAEKLDALSLRRRGAFGVLIRSGGMSEIPDSRREAGLYLKRSVELLSDKRVPLSEPKLSAPQDVWTKWDRAIFDIWGFDSFSSQWPKDFWKTLDRKKISQPIGK